MSDSNKKEFVFKDKQHFLYRLTSPLDWFEGTLSLDLIETIHNEPKRTSSYYRNLYDCALSEAKDLGWDGVFRGCSSCWPVATLLPAIVDGPLPAVLMWKAENNGDTFVLSPHELPWLEDKSL